MTRLRAARWSGQLLQSRGGASPISTCSSISRRQPPFLRTGASRYQSSAASASIDESSPLSNDTSSSTSTAAAAATTTATATSSTSTTTSSSASATSRTTLPAPPFERAAQSAKLAALHARLSLSKKIPLQTLARSLVTPSADINANFNNSNLAFLGSTIINYHVLEYLVCKWPRLPMSIAYEALRAYAGQESLQQVARRWGVESAAAPGEEVDPGLLQWKIDPVQSSLVNTRWGYVREEVKKGENWRRGISSRVVFDDDFGDAMLGPNPQLTEFEQHQAKAFESFVQAVVGSIYTHCGREEAKLFVKSHILARQIEPSALFQFNLPTRELALLCAREGFYPPVARLESETGRMSRTPVYVVGIYSGKEKLGEGAGPSLDVARRKACMASLKAWYLYSPGNKVRVPSDMMEKDAKPWTPPHIDLGEII